MLSQTRTVKVETPKAQKWSLVITYDPATNQVQLVNVDNSYLIPPEEVCVALLQLRDQLIQQRGAELLMHQAKAGASSSEVRQEAASRPVPNTR